MGKTRFCWVICIIILGLVAPTVAQDSSLVGWWKMDGDGTDSSGNGHDGVLEGDAHFAAGYLGQALALDGDGDYFAATDYKGLLSSSPTTVTTWVQTTGNGDMVYWGRSGGGRRVEFRVNGGRLRIDNGRGNLQGDTTMNDGEWHHAAVTIPVDAEISYPFVKLYLDGRDDTRPAVDPQNHTFRLNENAANDDVSMGVRGYNDDRYFPGLLDDVRIYEEVLNEAQIQDIMEFGYFASAHSPSPAAGGKYEEPWANLEWVPGPLAVSHDLYFGTRFEDVNAGAESAFWANLTTNSQFVGVAENPAPEGLQPGTTYYWRVDPVDEDHPDSPWRGNVWSFWIPSVHAYDPFPADGEPFEDPNLVLTWAPGLKAIFSTLYIGTDVNEVATATAGPPTMETVYDPGPLEFDTTYYWRADTFNGMENVQGLLWSFKTLPEIPVGDPNLILWYTFDEGAGSNVVDWSGHENHGELFGPQWSDTGVGGDGALIFDAANEPYVAIGNLFYDDANNPEVTVSAWVRTTDPNQQVVASFDRSEFWRLEINTELAGAPLGPGRVGWHLMTMSGDSQIDTGSKFRVDDGQWHHLCGVFDNGTLTTYIDGQSERSVVGGPAYGDEIVRYGYLGTGSEATVYNGTPRTPASYFNGDMDDVRVYDRALTAAEILELTRTDPLAAWDFQPRMNRVFETGAVTLLSWKPGDGAAQHDVYFGTDADAVAGADASDATGLYRGRQAGTTYGPPEALTWGTTYYWRIDEVGSDGAVTEGRVLTFTIADYFIVDDFESYTNDSPDRLFQTWVDGLGFSPSEELPDGHPGNGSGATVGNDIWSEGTAQTWIAERRLVFDGGQSMPIDYNNVNPPYYSETERTWPTPQNWNRSGVDTLTVYYTAGPLADPNVQGLADLYVVVQDSAGGVALVRHPDPNTVRQTGWLEWNIPLADLASAGVNTSAVQKMVIGLGNRDNRVPNGAGRIYIDAIRLTRPQPPAVDNFSFEQPGTEKLKGFDSVPGWSTDGPVADSGVETEYTPTDGEWTAYLMGGDPAVWQLTGRTINEGDVYELKVDARITWAAETLRMSLYYDDAGVRVPVASADVALTDAMQEYALTFAADELPAAIGHKIGVELANPGSNWIGLDNVRLDLVPSQ